MSTTAAADLVCAVFMAILYARHFADRGLSKSNRQLDLCLAVMLGTLLIDASAYIFVGPAYALPFRFFINFLSFLASCVNVICFTFYMEALLGEKAEIRTWPFHLLKTAELVLLFATAYEFIAGHLLTYDVNGIEDLNYAFPRYIVVLNLAVHLFMTVITVINGRRIGRKLAVLLCVISLAPILASLLYSFAGVDIAYAIGAVTLGLVAESVQKKQTLLLKQEQAVTRELANQQRIMRAFGDMVNAAAWSMKISDADEVTDVSWSDELRRMLGYEETAEDFPDTIGVWEEIIHPEDREQARKDFYSSLKSRDTENYVYDTEYRARRKTGEYSWYHVVARMENSGDGGRRLFGIASDISAERQLKVQRTLSDGLAREYHTVWLMDGFGEHNLHLYRSTGRTTVQSAVRLGLDKPCFDTSVVKYIRDNVAEEDQERVIEETRFDTVARETPETGTYVVTYRRYTADRTGFTYHQMCFARAMGADGTVNYILAYRDADRMMREQIAQREERKRAQQTENDLTVSRLRADSLAFIEDNEPDMDNAINFFGRRILEIFGCDQVVYRELDGRRTVLNAPGSSDVPVEVCARCPFARFDCEAFSENGTVLMDDCSLGCRGVMAPADCPAKSSFMQMIYSGGSLEGKLTVHYLKDRHAFTENEIGMMKIVATYFGLMIGRIRGKQAELARIAAESANKAKTDFLFSMSHDIRTPMNAILGYTDIALRHGDDPERVRDSLGKIRTSGGHLLNLINDILEMSRIESGKLELAEDPFDLREVLKGVDQMAGALAVKKSIDFTATVRGFRNPYVRSDELHLNEVIINLISNAVKYTEPGGKVICTAEQLFAPKEGIARYRFTVADTGIGMSEEFQQHLFESFSREESAAVAKQEGTGLGLSIVRRIVDMMGGAISVNSRKGQGSAFTVDLPLKVMDEEEIAAFRAEREKDAALPAADADLKGRRILLVEDNEMNREIASELLTEAGLLVETAEDGEIAVRTVAEKGVRYYDAVLMDIQMPVMNGYEATAEIRRLPGAAALPIIALSANAFVEDVDKSLAAGMDAHLAKPIVVSELFAELEKFIG